MEPWYKSLVKNAKITKNKNDQCNHATNLSLKMRKSTKTKTINGIMQQSCGKKREVYKNKNDQSNPKTGGQTPKPPMPLAARHWFQRVQNPEPNKLHNASKSCSRQNTSTKTVAKFTTNTHMINGVLLLVFQCPNAQTLAT